MHPQIIQHKFPKSHGSAAKNCNQSSLIALLEVKDMQSLDAPCEVGLRLRDSCWTFDVLVGICGETSIIFELHNTSARFYSLLKAFSADNPPLLGSALFLIQQGAIRIGGDPTWCYPMVYPCPLIEPSMVKGSSTTTWLVTLQYFMTNMLTILCSVCTHQFVEYKSLSVIV